MGILRPWRLGALLLSLSTQFPQLLSPSAPQRLSPSLSPSLSPTHPLLSPLAICWPLTSSALGLLLLPRAAGAQGRGAERRKAKGQKAEGLKAEELRAKRFQRPDKHSLRYQDKVREAKRLIETGKDEQGLKICQEILEKWANHAPCLTLQGKVMWRRGRVAEARQLTRNALDADANWFEAYYQLAQLLSHQAQNLLVGRDIEGAYESYRSILLMELDGQALPGKFLADTYFGMGKALHAVGMHELAMENLEIAIRLDKGHLEAYYKMGEMMIERGADGLRVSEVLEAALKMQFRPHPWAELLYRRNQVANWKEYHTDMQRLSQMLIEDTDLGRCSVSASLALKFPLPTQVIRTCAEAASRKFIGPGALALNRSEMTENLDQLKPMRIVYLTDSNFAGSQLPKLLEYHDSGSIKVLCVDLAHQDVAENTGIRVVPGACDEFYNFGDEANTTMLASKMLALKAHVLLDLSGHFNDRAMYLLASRTALVQCNWQGFPSSLGASFVQFLKADKFVSPPEMQHLYTESFMMTDGAFFFNSHAEIQHHSFKRTRSDYGLPEERFVYAFFGDLARIDPQLWGGWMEVMRLAKGSVLWLTADHDEARQNLWVQAMEYGIHKSRIIVSPVFSTPAEEMEAMRIADLFLDSRQLSAGSSTVCNALWAGLPILTIPGDSLSRRSTASLLTEAGLGRVLIARNLEDYEELAVTIQKMPAFANRLRTGLHSLRDNFLTSVNRTSPDKRLSESQQQSIWNGALRQRGAERLWRMTMDLEIIEEDLEATEDDREVASTGSQELHMSSPKPQSVDRQAQTRSRRVHKHHHLILNSVPRLGANP